jgi:hypothetical protein
MLALLRYYPQGILLVAEWGVERERVARRLRHQQRELETHRYKLQQLEKLSERGAEDGDQRGRELRIAMNEERRNIRHHKGRVRHLASRMGKLDRRGRHRGAVRQGWKSLKSRLGLLARG